MVPWGFHHYHHYPQEPPYKNEDTVVPTFIWRGSALRGRDEAVGSQVDYNLHKWYIVGLRPPLFLSHTKAFAQSKAVADR